MSLGFTFGEAAYASQAVLSWQTTVVGDPLYCPFAKPLPELLAEQDRAHSKWIEWSYLRLANLSLVQGRRPSDVMAFLQSLPITRTSAVLTEKLADLYSNEGMPSSAIETYQNALQLSPSTLQAVRIRLGLADKLVEAGRTKDAYADLKALLNDDPEYPGKEVVLKKIQNLAGQIGGAASASTLPHRTNP